jgi:hypothetical protein
MHARFTVLRRFAILAVLIPAPVASVAAAEDADQVGLVNKVENQAQVISFRFATGKIKELKDKKIAVSTPVADIGVRGTEFWGGPINARYGVLLIEGEVTVSNQAGSVTLIGAGEGTDVPSPLDAPGAPSAWPAEKVARAVASVALH